MFTEMKSTITFASKSGGHTRRQKDVGAELMQAQTQSLLAYFL